MNEQLKLTPIDQIEDMADGVPVLAVEGTVGYAAELTRGQSAKGHPWTKQFFVLSSGTASVACSMWDAEGSEVSKGETLRIENTQNKKGVWSGMVKGSYVKNNEEGKPVRKHTLEIRANQVKITAPGGGENNATPKYHDRMTPEGHADEMPKADPDWPEAPVNAPESSVQRPNGNPGVTDARKHLCQAANLYNLCVKCVNAMIADELPEVARTSEQFQAAVGTLFIEASRAGYVQKMPETPLIHK